VTATTGAWNGRRREPVRKTGRQKRASVDVRFEDGLPRLLEALYVKNDGGAEVPLEVQQHLDDRTVRSISLAFTAGLQRGMKVRRTGGPVTVPVGEEVLGHMHNVLGRPLDVEKIEGDLSPEIDSPRGAAFQIAGGGRRRLRDRHQDHRPSGPP